MSSAIDELVARYTPAIAREFQQCRATLYKLVPRGYELVYDNYNALACGFSPTTRASDALISVAAYPRWVTLFFLQGKSLPDPDGLLQGSGSRVRSIRLDSSADLDRAAVRKLIEQALRPAAAAFATAPATAAIVKSVSAKQRPRRPAASAPGKRKHRP